MLDLQLNCATLSALIANLCQNKSTYIMYMYPHADIKINRNKIIPMISPSNTLMMT